MNKAGKILVFGKHGQLAQSFARALPATTIFLDVPEIDFMKPDTVLSQLEIHQPEVVINCSAYTAVDLAEKEKESSLQINAKTPGEIANWCRHHKIPLIHFSTDYVFSGTGTQAWTELDTPSPVNWYGDTKWQGDLAIAQAHAEHLIFRISWVYSEFGKNFVKTMLQLGATKDELKIVHDQIGSPTYAPDVANAVAQIVGQAKVTSAWGTYHLSGPQTTDWCSFAQALLSQARLLDFPLKVQKVLPILTTEYPTPAKRPLNSRLDSAKFQRTFGLELPAWTTSLSTCLQNLKG
jgi:dTDP-4-dehydrorhamnose reductase